MCGPMVVPILMVASAAIGAYATYEGGQTEKRFANYEAAQGQANAQAERGDAEVEADRIRKAGARAAGEANVALAASGQNVASAGALGINREISRGTSEDAYFALLGGRDRSNSLNAQAGLTKARGKAAASGATLSAFGQAVGGAAQGWSAYKKATK